MAEKRLDPARSTVDLLQQTINRRYQPIGIVELGQSTVTIYTAGDFLDFMVRSLWVCETSGAANSISLYLVPPGGTAGGGNCVYLNAAIAASQTQRLAAVASDVFGMLIPPGYTLRAHTGGGAMTIGGWGHDLYGD